MRRLDPSNYSSALMLAYDFTTPQDSLLHPNLGMVSVPGTRTGADYVRSPWGTALRFDTNTEGVDVPFNNLYCLARNPAQDSFGAMAWIRTTMNSGVAWICGSGDVNEHYAMQLYWDGSKLVVRGAAGASAYGWYDSDGTTHVGDGEWHLIGVNLCQNGAWKGSNQWVQIFVDGKEDAWVSTPGSRCCTGGVGNWSIGKQPYGTGESFVGEIAMVAWTCSKGPTAGLLRAHDQIDEYKANFIRGAQ